MKIKVNGDLPISTVIEQVGCKTEQGESDWFYLNMVFEKRNGDLFIQMISEVPQQVREDFNLNIKECHGLNRQDNG